MSGIIWTQTYECDYPECGATVDYPYSSSLKEGAKPPPAEGWLHRIQLRDFNFGMNTVDDLCPRHSQYPIKDIVAIGIDEAGKRVIVSR